MWRSSCPLPTARVQTHSTHLGTGKQYRWAVSPVVSPHWYLNTVCRWVIYASAYCYELGMFIHHILSFLSKCQDDAETWQVEQGWNSIAPGTIPEQCLLLQDRKRSHHARGKKTKCIPFWLTLALQNVTKQIPLHFALPAHWDISDIEK